MHTRFVVPALALASLLAAPLPSVAGARKDPRPEFYKAKKEATTLEGWARAQRALRRVKLGVPEVNFLEAMGMEVLALGGKPHDVRLDGYLAEASKRANATASRAGRHLAFGWIDGDREVIAVTVVMRNHRVAEIRADADVVASLDSSEPGRSLQPAPAAHPGRSSDTGATSDPGR